MGKKKEAKKADKLSKEEKKLAKEIKKRDKAEVVATIKALPVPKGKQLKAELRRVFGKKLEPTVSGDAIYFDGVDKLRDKFDATVFEQLLFHVLTKCPSYPGPLA